MFVQDGQSNELQVKPCGHGHEWATPKRTEFDTCTKHVMICLEI